ncbi:Hypothetical Protein CTN_0324 [Thermotoga neapolitana DSM 4359]|uniref:Uncharacterized protein n=1 Tax=Thermotoga neapolitana (strain ATCC 49049 / DSM 4359 / NBRC 107923 / NS-E) TaxID=309803 RepID=B9KBV4_THENN|nr:Hypothetical Protein CTN_0324 [Thermotoga neapolitana DSM 4359]
MFEQGVRNHHSERGFTHDGSGRNGRHVRSHVRCFRRFHCSQINGVQRLSCGRNGFHEDVHPHVFSVGDAPFYSSQIVCSSLYPAVFQFELIQIVKAVPHLFTSNHHSLHSGNGKKEGTYLRVELFEKIGVAPDACRDTSCNDLHLAAEGVSLFFRPVDLGDHSFRCLWIWTENGRFVPLSSQLLKIVWDILRFHVSKSCDKPENIYVELSEETLQKSTRRRESHRPSGTGSFHVDVQIRQFVLHKGSVIYVTRSRHASNVFHRVARFVWNENRHRCSRCDTSPHSGDDLEGIFFHAHPLSSTVAISSPEKLSSYDFFVDLQTRRNPFQNRYHVLSVGISRYCEPHLSTSSNTSLNDLSS